MKKLATLVSVAALGLSMMAVANADDHYKYPAYGFGYGGGYVHSPEGFGPQGFAPTTIAQVIQSAYDDQIVVLKGRLTNYLGHDHYEFTDGTGVIEVDLDDDYNWSFISKDQLIVLTAEVDRDFLSVTLDAIQAAPLERAPMQGGANYNPAAAVAPAPVAPASYAPQAVAPQSAVAPQTAAPVAPAAPVAK